MPKNNELATEAAFSLQQGNTPLLLSIPHNAARIPASLAARMHPYAQSSPDTDWYVDRLYKSASQLGIGVLKPTWSRYVMDLNRPPDDQNLYPGSDTTGLCPISCFDNRPIYLTGQEPDAVEIQDRLQAVWQPYHQALQAEIGRIKAKFGIVLVYEAHSIASQVPRFFAGSLPDLNLGTNNGASCDPEMAEILQTQATSSGLSWVLNGRFKGGYITRAYAAPQAGIHTFQLELSQATYLDEATRNWHEEKAIRVQAFLFQMLTTLLNWTMTKSDRL